MKNTSAVCSKMWTDTNIDFKHRTLKHCCKQTSYLPTEEDWALGADLFERYPENIENRRLMLEEDTLPPACRACHKDNLFKDNWNRWSDTRVARYKPTLQTDDRTEFIELDLGDQCDLACVYCGPWSSTTWKKQLNIPIEPIDTQWQQRILTRLYARLAQTRDLPNVQISMLGGEPTLMTSTYDMLEDILPHLEHHTHKPTISFCTNLNTGDKLMQRFLDTMERTREKVNWSIGVSMEAEGRRAELIRTGLNFRRFTDNLQRTSLSATRIYITCTHNYLNVPYFHDFVDWLYDIMPIPYNTGSDTAAWWDFTNNSVTQGALSVDYIDPVDVPWQTIYDTLDRNCVAAPVKQHLENIRQRSGRSPDEIFLKGVQQLVDRDPELVTYFPHLRPHVTL